MCIVLRGLRLDLFRRAALDPGPPLSSLSTSSAHNLRESESARHPRAIKDKKILVGLE